MLKDLPGQGPERGDIYRRIGVEPIINGATTMTYLGGSIMPPPVVEAMRQASECFVDLFELQDAVGRRIAELTRNEAAFVSGGAAAGLFLSAVVCMARDMDEGVVRPDELTGSRATSSSSPAIGSRTTRQWSLPAGGSSSSGPQVGTSEADLLAAIGPDTAGILYVAGDARRRGHAPNRGSGRRGARP